MEIQFVRTLILKMKGKKEFILHWSNCKGAINSHLYKIPNKWGKLGLNPQPEMDIVSEEEARRFIKTNMEKDEGGIKKRNPRRSVESLEKLETSGMWKQILQEGNKASDRLTEAIRLFHVPHTPTSL